MTNIFFIRSLALIQGKSPKIPPFIENLQIITPASKKSHPCRAEVQKLNINVVSFRLSDMHSCKSSHFHFHKAEVLDSFWSAIRNLGIANAVWGFERFDRAPGSSTSVLYSE